MANNNDMLKLSTCPICGYQAESTDATALRAEMEDHVRSAHNMELSSLNTGADIKPEPVDTSMGTRDVNGEPTVINVVGAAGFLNPNQPRANQ